MIFHRALWIFQQKFSPSVMALPKFNPHYCARSQRLLLCSVWHWLHTLIIIDKKNPWQLVAVVDEQPFHGEKAMNNLFMEKRFSSTRGTGICSHKATSTCFVVGFKFSSIYSTGPFTSFFFFVRSWSLYFVHLTYFVPQRTDHFIAAGTLKIPSLNLGWGTVMSRDTWSTLTWFNTCAFNFMQHDLIFWMKILIFGLL